MDIYDINILKQFVTVFTRNKEIYLFEKNYYS